MRQNAPNLFLFIGLTAIAAGLFWAAETYVWPPKPKPVEAPKVKAPDVPQPQPQPLTVRKELVAALAGPGVIALPKYDNLPSLPPPPKPAEIKPSEPRALIALGDDSYFLKVLLTNKGGGVQQVVLTQFDDASRLGLEIKMADGKSRPLHLIPGYKRSWNEYLAEEPAYVPLAANLVDAKAKPGRVSFDESMLSAPSYVLLHYPSRDDPRRARGDDGEVKGDDDNYPLAELGERAWTVASIEPGKVVFETEVAAPYFVKLRKIFTLAAKEYDFKLSIEIEPLPGRVRGAGKFRYQMVGPLGMPIEGEWYTTTYRNAYVGWTDAANKPRRAVEDPASTHYKSGSDKVNHPGIFHYAGIGTQYFASAIAVEGDYTLLDQPWDYVRVTMLAQFHHDPAPPHLVRHRARRAAAGEGIEN